MKLTIRLHVSYTFYFRQHHSYRSRFILAPVITISRAPPSRLRAPRTILERYLHIFLGSVLT